MPRDIIIDSVNVDSKCWVVRSGVRYRYAAEFYDGGFVATGHLDNYDLAHDLFDNNLDYANLAEHIPELDSLVTRNIRTQIENFILDMKVGDVVFTMDGRSIIPGVIKSEPYLSLDAISQNDRFCVRRTVEWGQPINRASIPITIQKSFNAYQAIFSLGNNSKEIFHWLLSFFIWEGSYYGSLRVEQPHAIKHHSLKQLSELIDRIQVLSLLIGEHVDNNLDTEFNLTFDELQRAMERFSESGELNLTVQQMLMSPGDLWLKFTSQSRAAGIAFFCALLAVSSPAASLTFVDQEYNDNIAVISEIVNANRDTIFEGIDVAGVKRQLILDAGDQNSEFVASEPTKNPDEEFPEDGEPRHVGG
ncbi:hypothetical protein C3E80_04030 [Cronobacter malonaticus]|uniref:Uncharacterized protein n=3 Tax=Enterobacteriaceae TaxID=543 RepID=A0AA45C0T3_CROSK|nr:hypothetical protein B7T09_07860 [Cronobacter sakazakii]PUV99859.1 hypothetical protein B7T12_02260 [Cronobacter sakazakii]PUW04713.1 hypothetical protein B7T07_12790 [Cronobacter sakazakii]ROW63686.1 hypothetical protein C3E80_04030 [Cronobacter malonaticus]RRA40132.1 hypothetical protein C4882_14235 [Cronobacter malonaticus]